MVFDKPYLTNFTLGDLLSAFSSIPNADPYFIVEVMGTNMAHAMASVIQIVIWCFAVWVVSFLAKKVEDVSFKDWAICTVAPATLIICGFLGASSQFGYPIELGTGALLFGIVGVIGVLIGFCLMLRETVTGATPGEAAAGELLGTKIGELESVRGFGFDMIGGLRDVKNEIKEAVVVPLTRPELSEKFGISPPKGILLFGPPGCGKTMLMRALAAELQVEMVSVKCSDIMSKWYGESEEKIAGLFATAKKRKPCILFLDEIDAIAKSRDMYGADDVTPRLLSIMLSEMDGMDKTTGVVVVATTNKPELLDPALLRPGRFDKVIYVPPPDYHERLDILRVHFAGKPIAPDVDIDLLAKRTERFSGADLANLVKEAATIAMRRALQQSEYRKAGVSTRSS
jgi:ATP-dependent Zn protease